MAVIFADPTTGDLDSVISDHKLMAVIHALLWSHHYQHAKIRATEDDSDISDIHPADSLEVKLEADPLLTFGNLRETSAVVEDEDDICDNDDLDDIDELDDEDFIQVGCDDQRPFFRLISGKGLTVSLRGKHCSPKILSLYVPASRN